MSIICMIPARYASTRLPGKPLINICGKPMLQRVYERVDAMKLFDDIYVATDSDKIENFCSQNNIKSIMTPVDCISGTDRVSLAIQKLNINIDAVVIIMGDEPLIEKKDVELLINCYTKNPEFVISLKRKIKDEKDVDSNSTIKAVCDKNDNLMFLSRSRIPYPQKDLYFDYYKILGCYIFPFNIIKNHFDLPVGYLEKIEALDSFRLLENGIKIKCYETDSDYFSVDVVSDIIRCEQSIKEESII